MRNCANFTAIGQPLPRYGDLSYFSLWRPYAILDLLCAYFDHPRRAFGDLYRYSLCKIWSESAQAVKSLKVSQANKVIHKKEVGCHSLLYFSKVLLVGIFIISACYFVTFYLPHSYRIQHRTDYKFSFSLSQRESVCLTVCPHSHGRIFNGFSPKVAQR